MVFSDEKEIVLNNLLVSVRNSIDQYRLVAELIDDDKLAGIVEELAADRREVADKIEALLTESGYLPAEPDPDRQLLTELATRIKAAISGNDRTFLPGIAEQLENTIETHLQETYGLHWPEPVIRKIAAIEARLNANRAKIRAVRP